MGHKENYSVDRTPQVPLLVIVFKIVTTVAMGLEFIFCAGKLKVCCNSVLFSRKRSALYTF